VNSRGQFSIIAALLVAVVLIGTVITTYATLRYSTIQDQPQVLSAIDETNLALEKVLGFTVGYYGSVLQVTGDSSYAKSLTTNYLNGSLNNIADIQPEWGAAFSLTALDLSANWFTNASYSAGRVVVTYDLTGLGISGMSYNASCRLDVQVLNSSSSSKACLNITKDGSEPLINLGKQNFKFYQYQYSNLTWNYETPSGELTAFANGTYLIDFPPDIDSSSFVVQVTDTRGIMVAAASFSRITSTLMWNTTTSKGADYVDSSTINVGTQSNFTAQQYGPDGIYDILTEGTSGPVLPNYYPSSYILNGGTANVSGLLSYLQFDDGVRMIFRSYASATSAQTLYTHQETTSIAGTPYYTLLSNSADASGLTLTTPMSSSRVFLGQSVYSLQGVSSIPASTWTVNYRAWRDATTNVSTNSPSSTTGGWTNPTNAYADGSGYAYSTMDGTKQVYSGYGFSVLGGSSITQVRVRLDAYCSGGDSNDKILLEVSDGTNWLATTQQQSLTTSETTYWINVTGWTSWTPTKVNSMQVRVTQIRSGSLTDQVRLDWVPIEVCFSVTNGPTSSNASSNSAGWTNPTNAYADGSGYASSTVDGNQQVYGGYGFSLPSNASVIQVRVGLDTYRSGGDGNDAILLGISNGTWLSTTQEQSLTTSEATYWIDITGWTSWTPTNINSIQTRVNHVRYGSSTDEVRLDYIQVEVTYTVATTTVTYSPISNSGTWTNPGNAHANGGGYAESDANGEQQRYWGYNFALPSNAVINQVRVRLDAWTYRPYGYDSRDDIGLQVSVDGGSSWLPVSPSVQQLTGSEATYWIDVTSWTSWTPTQVNNIQARVTHVREGSANEYVRLDWIPIEVTYSAATVSTDNAASNSAGWTNPANAYSDGSGYASSTTDGNQQVYSGYSFSLPSNATVTQVRVRLDAYYNGGGGDDKILLGVSNGTWLSTTQELSLTWSEATSWVNVTSWANWTPTSINGILTRVNHVRYGSSTDEVRLDYISVEVTCAIPYNVTQSPSSNSVSWINPANAYADGSSYAYSANDGDQQVYGGYGFSIPSGTQIAQVLVRLDAWCATDDDVMVEVSSDGGLTWLATTQTLSVATSETTYWVNVTSWASWTPAMINSDNIKARVTHVAVSSADEVRLDWIPINVTYTIPISVHADINVLIRRSDNSTRATIATNVAPSGDLQTTATTLSGTYSWSNYTVVNQTDYLEVDYYVDVANTTSSYAYLRIDDQTLDSINQTRIDGIMLPSEYTSEVELIGASNTESWAQLAWATDSNCSIAGVNVTAQLYNYQLGRYALSGENGYNSTTIGTSDVAMTQNVTSNPTVFRDSSTGEWKLKFKAVKSTTTQFDLGIDLARYSPVPNYLLDIEEQWTNVNYAYPRQDLCVKTGNLSLNENLMVEVRSGSSWITVFDSLQPNTWNNVSVTPYVSSQNFTVRFRDSNNNSDTTPDSWYIDAVLLNPQPDVDVLLSKLDHTIVVELLQNGTMRWLGQNLQLTTQEKPVPPIPVKAIHVNQTINGVNQEVPFQVEDWASEYRIPLGLTNNATVFSSRQMIVFLVNVNVSKVTVWWNGSDTATQTPKAYTNIYFTGDDQDHSRLTNGKLTLQFESSFTVTSTVGSASSTANFMRINTEASTYGAGLAYVIHHGIVRDVVQQEAEWGTSGTGIGGADGCPNVYANIVLTLPANATYYTSQLRLMFIDSTQLRNITDLCPIKLTTSIDQLQTENGTVNGIPIVTNGTGNFSSSVWAHHWSQFISGSQGAGILFTNASNQQLYVFDSMPPGTPTGALKTNNSTKTIELLPVTLRQGQFTYALDVTWHGAVATFDGTATPIYTIQGTAPTGLWLLVEYPPKITVTSES
jgi:hypothetical protein